MAEIYQVGKGDSPWKFAQAGLGDGASAQEIAAQVSKLPSIYGCKSMEEFQRKYFSKPGEKIEIKFGSGKPVSEGNANSLRNQDRAFMDTISRDSVLPCDAIKDSNRTFVQRYQDTIADLKDTQIVKRDTTSPVQKFNRVMRKRNINFSKAPTKNWAEISAKQNKINAMKSDKERIIEFNKTMGNLKDNYVIVDKKNFTATVYTPDGKVVKAYEIGVAKNESDALLRRSKRNPQNNIASTSAGIYTANYKATGRDAYRRLYNDRVLTLSNDGLREKGVGNGETGVAFHQVPNGNTARTRKLKAEGVSKENNRFSSGCVNFLPEDFDDCMKNIKGVGTKVYILPEDENNYISVKNGQLQFSQKKYTGDVATTTTKNNPIKNIRITSKNPDLRQEGLDMAATLSANKMTLSKELGLDNDTYNNLALLTLGIAGQETRYGSPLAGASDGKPYWLKENCEGLVNFAKSLKGNNSYNSRGLTQMKLNSYTDPEVKKLFEKYGITEDNLGTGHNSAIATMIVLSCIYKNELPALKEQMEKQNVSPSDALLYCWSNHKSEVKNGTATPDKNEYLKNVHKFMDNFNLFQSAA